MALPPRRTTEVEGVRSRSKRRGGPWPLSQIFLPAEYTFEAGLDNHDRAVVHSECKKFGFSSKSHGYAAGLELRDLGFHT